MLEAFKRIAAVPCGEGRQARFSDWMRSVGPLLAPILIGLCDTRMELIKVALAWIVLLVPGILACNLLFRPSHPLGRGVARLGVASVLGWLPFGIFSYAGCLLHWHLNTVLWCYGAVYVIWCIGCVLRLARRPYAAEEEWASIDLEVDYPRWTGLAVIAGIALVMVGVAWSSPPWDATRFNPAQRPGWWHGTALGAAGSLLAAAALLAGLWKTHGSGRAQGDAAMSAKTAAGSPQASSAGGSQSSEKGSRGRATTRSGGRDRDARGRGARRAGSELDWTPWLAALLWIASAGMTFYVMKVTYTETVPEPDPAKRSRHLKWNVDDVAYVSEAVDYRYGHVMGKYEPSIGSEHGMSRGGMSPLTAPLVATIARVTGISCAALHHSVMPPLIVLIGVSGLSAALMVVFRMHRLAVPLGLLVALILIFKSWDYARCVVEMLAFRAMQTKAIHLWVIHPLQLASLVLVLTRPSWRHLMFAVVVASVGHWVHPFATILGTVWAATMLVAAMAMWRRSLLPVVLVLGIYCAWGGVYSYVSKRPMEKGPPPSGRVAGSPIQSRDLVRVDAFKFSLDASLAEDLNQGRITTAIADEFGRHDVQIAPNAPVVRQEEEKDWMIQSGYQTFRISEEEDGLEVYEVAAEPALRHDPFWAFGCNTLYSFGAMAVPILLVFGWRRRELMCVGLLGAATLVIFNIEPLGKLINAALPASIMWRARWMLPALVAVAGMAVVLYWAVGVVLRGRGGMSGGRIAVAALAAVGAFSAAVAGTTSMALWIGDDPEQLDKFTDGVHGLVDMLGGTEAAPYVWGSFFVHHELPQLMPNAKLVFSRDKFMREADDPQYRQIALYAFNKFQDGTISAGLFNRLRSLYPIEFVVLDYRWRNQDKSGEMLSKVGWRAVGRSGPYELWRAPDGGGTGRSE